MLFSLDFIVSTSSTFFSVFVSRRQPASDIYSFEQVFTWSAPVSNFTLTCQTVCIITLLSLFLCWHSFTPSIWTPTVLWVSLCSLSFVFFESFFCLGTRNNAAADETYSSSLFCCSVPLLVPLARSPLAIVEWWKKEKRGKVRKFHWILPNESGTTKKEEKERVSQSEKIQMCKLMLLHLHWWHFSHHFLLPFFLSFIFILFHLPCNSRQLWLVCRLLIHCFVDTHTNTHCSGSCCHTKKRKLGISALSRAHATLVHQHLTFFKAENEWERKRMKVDQWW